MSKSLTKVSTELAEVLDSLDPKQREAVRLYTDPLLPTFGSKTASSKAAGYATRKVFRTPAVQQAIQLVEQSRAAAGAEVQEYMGGFVMDAARRWVESLQLGNTITIQDPEPLLGPPTEEERETAEEMYREQKYGKEPAYATVEDALGALVDGRLSRADQITKSNRVALQAAREANAAAEMIARYVLGHPEQRVHHTDDRDQPVDLDHLDHSELLELGQVIEDAINDKRATAHSDGDPSVVEAEWEEG